MTATKAGAVGRHPTIRAAARPAASGVLPGENSQFRCYPHNRFGKRGGNMKATGKWSKTSLDEVAEVKSGLS